MLVELVSNRKSTAKGSSLADHNDKLAYNIVANQYLCKARYMSASRRQMTTPHVKKERDRERERKPRLCQGEKAAWP